MWWDLRSLHADKNGSKSVVVGLVLLAVGIYGIMC